MPSDAFRKGVLLLCFFCASPWTCQGDDFFFTPFFKLSTAYNDNIFYDHSMNETESDSINTVSPGFILRERTERSDSRIEGYLNRITYEDNDSLDSTERSIRGTTSFNCTERSRVNAGGSYRQDSSPDRDIATTGLILGTAERDMKTYNASASYRLSEIWSTELAYAGESSEYDDADYIDSTSQSARLSVSRNIMDIIPNTSVFLDAGYYQYEYENSSVEQTDNYVCSLGTQMRLNELYDVAASIGYRHTTTMFDIPVWMRMFYDEENTTRGTVGKLILTRTGEKTVSSLRFSHDISSVGGQSSITERRSLILDIQGKLSRRLNLGLDASFHINRSREGEISDENIDKRTLSIQPAASYKINDDFSIKLYYSYAYLRDLEDKTTQRRSLTGLELTCLHDLFD